MSSKTTKITIGKPDRSGWRIIRKDGVVWGGVRREFRWTIRNAEGETYRRNSLEEIKALVRINEGGAK